MIGTNLAITTKNYAVAGGVTYDADALAYFIANTSITSTADKNAINTFYLGLKSDGIYTKIKAMYLPIWGSAASCKWNLVNPLDTNAAFRLTFSTGITYSSSGITFNGTSSYANTYFIPNINMSLNSGSIGYYGGNNLGSQINKTALGAVNSGQLTAIEPSFSGYGLFGNVNDGSSTWTANTNTLGFIFATRTTSTQSIHSIRGFQYLKSENTTGRPTVQVVLGARNNGTTSSIENYSAFQHRFDFIADGLTSIEATNLHNRVQTLMTYFGINV